MGARGTTQPAGWVGGEGGRASCAWVRAWRRWRGRARLQVAGDGHRESRAAGGQRLASVAGVVGME